MLAMRHNNSNARTVQKLCVGRLRLSAAGDWERYPDSFIGSGSGLKVIGW
jgi:hypothetical protein